MKGYSLWKKLVVTAFVISLCIAGLLTACTKENKDTSNVNSKKENTAATPTAAAVPTETAVVSEKAAENAVVTEKPVYETHEKEGAAAVYMTTDITPEGLMAIYKALGREAKGNKVAVKISTGEPGGNYYLSPDLIKGLVQTVKGTIVECNTAYGGRRVSTAWHLQTAKDHGFTEIADVDIMDADGSMSLPVANGSHLQEDLVGAHLASYDFVVVLSHFKGHAMGGFGGAIKNISIGIGSQEGKCWIHTAGKSKHTMQGGVQDDFLESMAEAAKAVSDYEGNGEKMLYINVMNNLSVDCDCDSSPAKPEMKDIGILASLDPVALDQACVDLVYTAPDGKALIQRIESRNGIHTLEHAEEIGLGSRTYELVSIDD